MLKMMSRLRWPLAVPRVARLVLLQVISLVFSLVFSLVCSLVISFVSSSGNLIGVITVILAGICVVVRAGVHVVVLVGVVLGGAVQWQRFVCCTRSIVRC